MGSVGPTHLTRDLLGDLIARVRRLSWLSVVVVAAVISFLDGFWATSLRGAVGAIERTQGPFASWLRTSTLTLPLFVGAVIVALLVARALDHRFARELATAAVAGALMVVLTTVVAMGQIAVTSAIDYRDQSQQLEARFAIHSHASAAAGAPDERDAVAGNPGDVAPVGTFAPATSRLAEARRATLRAHLKGLKQAAVIVLVTNALVTLLFMVLRGDRLWTKEPEHAFAGQVRRQTARDARGSPAAQRRTEAPAPPAVP